MKSNLDHHLGAWNMQLLNQPRKRIPVASWLVEQGELLGEIMYILGQGLGCICFVVFVVWESLFGERHPHDVVRHRVEEERQQAYFEEEQRLYKLRHGNLMERRASARNACELAEADLSEADRFAADRAEGDRDDADRFAADCVDADRDEADRSQLNGSNLIGRS